MGDGMMPIPQKLINRILTLEFIKMQELLPENWPDFFQKMQISFMPLLARKKLPT